MLLRYELWCAGLYSLLFAVDAFRLVTGRSGESERGYFMLAWMLHAGFFSAWWRCVWWNEPSAPVKCALTLVIAPMAPVVHVAVCVATFAHDQHRNQKSRRCRHAVRASTFRPPLGPTELYRDPTRTDEMFRSAMTSFRSAMTPCAMRCRAFAMHSRSRCLLSRRVTSFYVSRT
jgi:hypothetical protein